MRGMDSEWLPWATLVALGMSDEVAQQACDALAAQGLLVAGSHYVPTIQELFRDYATVNAALWSARQNALVRWVMCAETFRALKLRHREQLYPVVRSVSVVPGGEEIEGTAVRVIEATRHRPGQTVATSPVIEGRLFGVPIRIDPVARRPVFELIGEGEPR